MSHHILDPYYLSLTLLITIAYQLFFFSIAWSLHFDKLTDFAGGTNFVVLAIVTLALSDPLRSGDRDGNGIGGGSGGGGRGGGGDGGGTRQIVASVFMMVWGLRLSGFLLWRILKTGKDDRFDDKRNKFFSFLGFWIFQMIWVFTVSLPITFLNSPAISPHTHSAPPFTTATDILGTILFLLGLLLESLADAQKFRFRTTTQSSDRTAICTQGVWGWSRHPNYAGEILLQFGIWLTVLAPAVQGGVGKGAKAALGASVVGPLLLTGLLMFVSGLPLQERPGAEKRFKRSVETAESDGGDGGKEWRAYEEYLKSTSILIPMPQAVWRRLPVWVKRTVGCEWPMYVFMPPKEGAGDV